VSEAVDVLDRQLLAALHSDTASEAEAALERAYQRHAGALLSLVTHCIGDACVAEQVVDDVFVRLWDEARAFDPSRGSLRSYLTTQAYRRCTALGLGGAAMVEHDGDGLSNPWRRLSQDERVAIGLVHFGQMTSHEVADVLGVTPEALNSTIFGGLQRLAREIESQGLRPAPQYRPG